MLVTERTAQTTGRSFDSLAFAKHMEAVGFTRQQAEALAEEQGKLIDERLATKADIVGVRGDLAVVEVALKADLAKTKGDLEAKIETLRLEVKRDLAETKADIIKWVVGIGFAQTALMMRCWP
jgi:hypothetical protein